MYVIATGSLTDGISFTGPFNTPNDAHDYAEDNFRHWDVIELVNPVVVAEVAEPPAEPKCKYLVVELDTGDKHYHASLESAEYQMTAFMDGEAELYRCEKIDRGEVVSPPQPKFIVAIEHALETETRVCDTQAEVEEIKRQNPNVDIEVYYCPNVTLLS